MLQHLKNEKTEDKCLDCNDVLYNSKVTQDLPIPARAPNTNLEASGSDVGVVAAPVFDTGTMHGRCFDSGIFAVQ